MCELDSTTPDSLATNWSILKLGSYGASRSSDHEQEDNEGLHPGSRHILGLVGSRVVGNADIVHNKSSEVLLVLPYLKVINRFNYNSRIFVLYQKNR